LLGTDGDREPCGGPRLRSAVDRVGGPARAIEQIRGPSAAPSGRAGGEHLARWQTVERETADWYVDRAGDVTLQVFVTRSDVDDRVAGALHLASGSHVHPLGSHSAQVRPGAAGRRSSTPRFRSGSTRLS